VLVIQILCLFLGLVLGLFAVDPVSSLGLGELVGFGTGKASNEFLGEAVANFLACDGALERGLAEHECTRLTLGALMAFKGLHGSEGGSASDELVAEARLVGRSIVDLVVCVLCVAWQLVSVIQQKVDGEAYPNPC
jgi:hypothetical protein